MENIVTLRQCFDAQKFLSNARLAALISDTISRYDRAPFIQELEDESLDVWAAGGVPPEARKKLHETEEN